MLTYVLFGSSYAIAAAIQPGPLQAFLVSRVTSSGWKRALPASLAPLISDGPIAAAAILLLANLPPQVLHVLQAAGGVLLVYFAWVTFVEWRGNSKTDSSRSAPRTLFDAVLVNLLNPNPYLGWALVLGPTLHTAWTEHPTSAIALIVAFYSTLVITLAGFILLVGTTSYLGTRTQRSLVGISAGLLAGLGIYLLADAAWRFVA
jgi:threonine/homoserine/homoserine lactone efflux protein